MANMHTCTNKNCESRRNFDFNNQTMNCQHSMMTPMHHNINESFIIQPHCKGNGLLQSHCGLYNEQCEHQNPNLMSMDNFSNFQGPSIEDRLENTEKLIRNLNAKFEDIESNKHSAKNEFNRLVQTLTLTSDGDGKFKEPTDDEGNEGTSPENIQSESDADNNLSQNSSFDEETCNLNEKNLKQILKSMAHKQNETKSGKFLKSKKYMDNLGQKKGNKKLTKNIDKTCFSNSRYDQVEEDVEDEEFMPYYDERTKSYMIPGGQVDLQNYEESDSQGYNNEVSEQLYQNAKNSLNRTKILLMASQQDMELVNNISYNDISNDDIQKLNLSSKRVKNILRNKQKRKMHRDEYLESADVDESDSCKIQMSSELDNMETYEERQRYLGAKQASRNNLVPGMTESDGMYDPNRFIHQTTSSGNLVLYDSVMRASTQSPQEMMDPQMIQRISSQHRQMYNQNYQSQTPDEDEDNMDLLQDEMVAGKLFL